jgi:hypothetical protein
MVKWNDMFRKRAETADFSKHEVEAIFALHENNPLSGMGDHSVRERIIDDILAYHRMCIAKVRNVIPRAPAPAIREPLPTDAPIDLKAAQIAKKAGM